MVSRATKKVQTREALVNSALRLFASEGYEGVTVDAIAEASGVSRRTLFRYFPTKHGLVFHRQDEDLAAFREALDGAGMPAVRAALLEVGRRYAASARSRLEQYRIVQSSPLLMAREIELDRAWEEAIAAALTDRSEREARFTAGALIGLVRAVLREWLQRGCAEDLDLLAEQALNTLDEMRTT